MDFVICYGGFCEGRTKPLYIGFKKGLVMGYMAFTGFMDFYMLLQRSVTKAPTLNLGCELGAAPLVCGKPNSRPVSRCLNLQGFGARLAV